MSITSAGLVSNLARIRAGVERAAARAGRTAEEITLVAVSKKHSAVQIRQVYEAGVRHFGENRVQEWESKHGLLSDLDATWHMIGHLQSNKAAKAARLFHVVDSVDSIALAERLARAKEELHLERADDTLKKNDRLPVLIEVKLDPNSAKSGVTAEDLPRLVEASLRLDQLEVRGLMGVPPYFENAEDARPYFRRLRELRDAVRAEMGRELLPVLSTGMSHDFEIAIEEGATEVRIGTALFGQREEA